MCRGKFVRRRDRLQSTEKVCSREKDEDSQTREKKKRQRDRERDSQPEVQTDIEKHIELSCTKSKQHIDSQLANQTGSLKYRMTERLRGSQPVSHTGSQSTRQADRHPVYQTSRQAASQPDKHMPPVNQTSTGSSQPDRQPVNMTSRQATSQPDKQTVSPQIRQVVKVHRETGRLTDIQSARMQRTHVPHTFRPAQRIPADSDRRRWFRTSRRSTACTFRRRSTRPPRCVSPCTGPCPCRSRSGIGTCRSSGCWGCTPPRPYTADPLLSEARTRRPAPRSSRCTCTRLAWSLCTRRFRRTCPDPGTAAPRRSA